MKVYKIKMLRKLCLKRKQTDNDIGNQNKQRKKKPTTASKHNKENTDLIKNRE